MNKPFCFLMLFSLLAFSCVSKKPIRTLKEVQKTYKRKVESLDKLIEVSARNNRDMVGASIYYLGEALYDLDNFPKKWKLKSNSAIDIEKNKVINQLFKVYAINNDFNIRLLVLESLSRIKKQIIYDFYLDCLKTDDPIIIKMVLIKIRQYAKNESYDLKDGFQQVLSFLNNKKENITLIAADTLFYFKASEVALKSLEEILIQLENDFMKVVLVEKINIYQKYLREGKL